MQLPHEHNKRFLQVENEERQAGRIVDEFLGESLLSPCGVHIVFTYEAALRVLKLRCVIEKLFMKVNYIDMKIFIYINLNFYSLTIMMIYSRLTFGSILMLFSPLCTPSI